MQYSLKMSSPQFRKPKQKFQLHFEHEISSQIKKGIPTPTPTPTKLFQLFFTIENLLPLSFEYEKNYQSEFSNIIENIGGALGKNIWTQIKDSKGPLY